MTARSRVIAAVAAGLAVPALVAPGAAQARPLADPLPVPGTGLLHGLTQQADRIQRDLGGRVVGTYLTPGSDKVTVAVSDAAAADDVRRAGAIPQLVRYTAAQLGTVKAGLDGLAKAGAAGQARSWYVDPRTGTVVVKVDRTRPATARFDRWARAQGGKVTVTRAAGKLKPAADLLGGQQVNMSDGYLCSVGFNARSATGTRIFFTAGHCTQGAPTFSRNSVSLGTTRVSRFPGDDWGSVNLTNPAWTQRGLVERWSGTDVAVRGWSNAPVGSALCKSGRTTGWTCGTIAARNVTVNYGDGVVVSGLYEHSACVEGGDSGGSNMSGNQAQGVTSGSATINGLCLQKYGQPNESFSQPIGEALSASGASLVLG